MHTKLKIISLLTSIEAVNLFHTVFTWVIQIYVKIDSNMEVSTDQTDAFKFNFHIDELKQNKEISEKLL